MSGTGGRTGRPQMVEGADSCARSADVEGANGGRRIELQDGHPPRASALGKVGLGHGYRSKTAPCVAVISGLARLAFASELAVMP